MPLVEEGQLILFGFEPVECGLDVKQAFAETAIACVL